MSTQVSSSAALPIAYITLRILVVLNWLMGIAIVVLLVAMPTRRWIMSSLDLSPGAEAEAVIFGLRSIAVLGVVGVAFNYVFLERLLEIVQTVRAGDPFVASNARRLQMIAWVLLALQLLSMVIGGIAKHISTPDHPIRMSAGFSLAGWLAVLLTFLLARVFAQGALMREDLVGTV